MNSHGSDFLLRCVSSATSFLTRFIESINAPSNQKLSHEIFCFSVLTVYDAFVRDSLKGQIG